MRHFGCRGATLYATAPTYLVGFLLIGVSSDVRLMVAGRIVSGVGLGLTLSVPTVYIVDVTCHEVRGSLGVAPNLLCQLGIFFTYVVGNMVEWNLLAYIGSVLAIPFILFVLFIPESPAHLLATEERVDRAEAVLLMLDLDASKSAMEETRFRLQAQRKRAEASSSSSFCVGVGGSVLDTLSQRSTFRAFVAGAMLMSFFQVPYIE